MSEPSPNLPTTMTSSAAPSPGSDRRKPRISLAIATAFGLGYLPKAPGTWGSLGAVAISLGMHWIGWRWAMPYMDIVPSANFHFWTAELFPSHVDYMIVLLIAMLGVYVAD